MKSQMIYGYLAEGIIEYFLESRLDVGQSFQLQFELDEDVNGLYKALQEKSQLQKRLNSFTFNGFHSFSIDLNGVYLLVAANINNIHEDFLTALRNFTKAQDKGFEECSILFIHNTQLDSIIGGASNLANANNPLNLEVIKKRIKKTIESEDAEKGLKPQEKQILNHLLKKQDKHFIDVENSIFDYSVYLEILEKGKIEDADYLELGIFKDKAILKGKVEEKEIRKRLDKNISLHSEISNAHRYNTIDELVKNKFDSTGQTKLKNTDSWFTTSFESVIKSIDNLKSKKGIEYIPNEQKVTLDFLKCLDLPDGASITGKRTRNIFIFNPDHHNKLQYELCFNKKPKEDNIKLVKANHFDYAINSQEKSIQLTINLNQPTHLSIGEKVQYIEEVDSKKIKHTFKFATFPFAQSVLEEHLLNLKITNSGQLEISSDGDIIFNPNHTSERKDPIKPSNNYIIEEEQSLKLFHGDETSSDTGKIDFDITIADAVVPFQLVLADLKPKEISAIQVINKKLSSQNSLFYSMREDSSKGKTMHRIEHQLDKFYPSQGLREQLRQEFALIIDTELAGAPYYKEAIDGHTLVKMSLELPADIEEAYQNIIHYYQSKRKSDKYLLPSLTYIDEELKGLYEEYLKVIREVFDSLEEGQELKEVQENILKIGTIESDNDQKFIQHTALHPINVAYQLLLQKNVKTELPKEAILRLNTNNLLPYLRRENYSYYHVIENEETIGWTKYIKEETEGQTASKRFVPSLVQEKIVEFIDHFSFLFLDSSAPVKVNLVNQGDCLEILQGIFRYFKFMLSQKTRKPEDISPIDITIYGSDNYITKFEQLSKYDDIEQIYSVFGVDLTTISKTIDPDDLLKLYNEKVNFYNKGKNPKEYAYAHISFYQFTHDEGNNSDVRFAQNEMDKMDTALSLNGLMSETSSFYDGGAYWSSFGIKNNEIDNDLVNLAISYNQVANISYTPNKLEKNKCIALTIRKEIKNELEKIYRASQWTTFIDPKVDLSFFKENKDVVIIHYSDLYTASSNYDAITVTKKWEQYRDVILNYLNRNGIEMTEDDSIPVINMFNAINGEWLLKIAAHSQRYQIDKEKISILSAVKEMMAILDHSNITWVPMSLEEVLRVSGSVGLPQKEGLVSVKTQGQSGIFSDDLLMIGVEQKEGEIFLHFHPVEVKIGKSNQESKGEKQGEKTADYLHRLLNDDSINGAVYRNFFVKQLLTSADKLKLYHIWEGNNKKWSDLHLLKSKLLNDDFTIGHHLEEVIGRYSVLSFKAKDSYIPRSIQLKDSVYSIQLLETDGLGDLKIPIDELIERYDDSDCNIHDNALLRMSYHSVDSNSTIEAISTESVLLEESVNEQEITAPTNEVEHEPMEILFGEQVNSKKPLYWYPSSTDKVLHTNTGIIGTMGTGKTQFTKSLIMQMMQNTHKNVDQKKIGILIFDYKGDYIKSDFTEPTGAKVYELYHLPYNPLALSTVNNNKPLLPLHTAGTLQDTISKAFNLGNKQKAFLRELIMDTYSDAGIQKANRASWGKTAPTISDVCKRYLEDENAQVDSLHAALTELYEYEIFEPVGLKAQPLFELIDGITVINLSGYSPEIQNLVVAITLDLFYSQMQNYGHSKIDGNFRQLNKMILVDEADNFLSKNFDSLRKILKEGREYGVGTILSTQFLNHFSTGDNEYSNYILTWIIHRVNEIKDKEVSSLFDIPNKQEREELIGVIKGLEKHYSIVNLAGSKPIKIKDKAFWELVNE